MGSKLVLVTGASSGIGEATAKRYGASGAHVLLLARNAERLGAVANAIRCEGGTATAYPVDLSDAKAIEEVSARIAREAGTPDILINNAGAGRWLPLIETTPEEALAMIEVPYLAAFNLTRAFLPQMLVRRSGGIACVTSPASYLTWPNACAYIAARHALKGFADGLRSELHGTGITVTLVVLGAVETPYWEHNPGSRAHLPEANSILFPTLSPEQAAQTIVIGTEARRRIAVRPRLFRLLFVLNALMPNLVAAQLRRASRKR
ncbi:MAG: SDR family NAD(P)-dependent oxidoreductase [Methyloceanibacter sp.]|jgi:short-subunit dehydrogenase